MAFVSVMKMADDPTVIQTYPHDSNSKSSSAMKRPLPPPAPGELGEIVMSGIRQQWLNQQLVDYTLVTADGVEFQVHRSHIACFSDYISTMLFGEQH